ncbi:type II secretion system protein [Aliivibrio finisterrensis]|uniref:Type II secretion system protein n=1 Tax=Aliivibrio finisterrensis TaxID=511998 RepID=A0A6N6RTJ2_9GAMM|nr:type II secretion system protein [Aliivibrio finisterrensis]KAB2824744.1 type II secretion system protein [Aliivibrio finisterrensis]
MTAKGFTLIELVVVIVILSILAVAATSRFINLREDATTASWSGVVGSFRSGLGLVLSQHKVEGEPEILEVNGFDLSFHDTHVSPPEVRDYPVALTNGHCTIVWNALVSGVVAKEPGADVILGENEVIAEANGQVAGQCIYESLLGSVTYQSGSGEVEVQ